MLLAGPAAMPRGLLAGGLTTALVGAEAADGSPAVCSQLYHWFTLVILGKSSLFP